MRLDTSCRHRPCFQIQINFAAFPLVSCQFFIAHNATKCLICWNVREITYLRLSFSIDFPWKFMVVRLRLWSVIVYILVHWRCGARGHTGSWTAGMMGWPAQRVRGTLGFRALHVDVVFFRCLLWGKSFHLLHEILFESVKWIDWNKTEIRYVTIRICFYLKILFLSIRFLYNSLQ